MNLNPRQLDFLEKILEAEELLSASFLMNELKITSRTLMKDYSIINDNLKEFNMHIHFYKRKGFILNYDNINKKNELLFELQRYRRKMISGEEETDKRIQALLKQFILSENELKMQDLCQSIALSRTALIRLMKEVRKQLKQYQLEIETRPYYGMKISGNAASFRMAKLDIFSRPYDWYETLFEDQYSIDNDTLNHYRYTLIQALNIQNWQMDDSALSKAALLLEIMKQDLQKERKVEISAPCFDFIQNETEYIIAKNVFIKCNLPLIPQEIAFFAYYLIIHRDLSIPFQEENLTLLIKEEVEEGLTLLIKQMKQKRISPLENESFKAQLKQMMILFSLCHQFKHFEMMDSASYRSFERNSMVFMMIAKESLAILENTWHYKFSEEIICRFALLLFEESIRHHDHRKKLNIALGSTLENYSYHYIEQRLFERYKDFLNPLKVCRLYQLHQEDLSNIDCILVYDSGYSRRLDFGVQVLEIDMMLPSKELDRFFNEVIAPRFPLLTPFNQPLKHKILYHEEIKNFESFLKAHHIKANTLHVTRESAIILNLKEPDAEDLICIQLKKPYSLKQGKIKRIFVFNMDFDNSFLKMKNGDRLIRKIFHHAWTEELLFQQNIPFEKIIHTKIN